MRHLFIPSAASIAVHVLMLGVILAATITVTRRDERRPVLTDVVIAAPPPAQAAQPSPENNQPPQTSAPAAASLAMPTEPLKSSATPRNLTSQIQPSIPPTTNTLIDAPINQPQQIVSFAGLSGKAAQRVVYVVDASGGMVSSFAFIRAKLAHSIAGLSPTQHFQILVTRQQAAGDTVVRFTPPDNTNGDLIRALPANREAAIAWLRSLIVGGRSDPIEGLRSALALEPTPDLVFFLSRGFIRSSDDTAWSLETVLAELDHLNPRARRTGHRPVVIKTIQFLDDDPTGLMQAIAQEHGDGIGSFRVLTIDELADEGAQDQAIAAERDVALETAMRDVRTILLNIDTDARRLACGLALPTERQRVTQAIIEAERLLGPQIGDLVTPDAPLRARVALLRSLVDTDSASLERAVSLLDNLFLVDADADTARRIALLIAIARSGRMQDAQILADQIASDITLLGLPEQLAGEFALACARFGITNALKPGHAWQPLLIEARAAHDWSNAKADAFEALLALARASPAHQDDIWARVDAATSAIDFEHLTTEARFVRAMMGAPTAPLDAAELLLKLAESDPASARSCDAFWEASVLLQSLEPALAADVLERFTQVCPHDPRRDQALRATVAWTPELNTPVLARRLYAALENMPSDPTADVWRVRCAAIVDSNEAWPLLEAISPESRVAPEAMNLALHLVSDTIDPAALARSLALAERLASEHAEPLRARLVHALLTNQLHSALEHARRLDHDHPAHLLLLAKACLLTENHDEAVGHLDRLTRLAPQRSPEWWESWTLLLEVLHAHDAQESSELITAHLYRLSLIDPDFGGQPWRQRLAALRSSTLGYTGKP